MNRIFLLSALLTGFAGIALEVLWTRVLVMAIGGSTYAFTIVLVSFLLGIAIGGVITGVIVRFLKINLLVVFAIAQILIGILVIVSISALGELPFTFLELFEHGTPSFFSLQLHLAFMVGKIIILPTILMGISLPLLIQAAKGVGAIYGANTFGGVLGALAASFVILPLIGVQRGILFSGSISMVVGLGLMLLSNTPKWSKGLVFFISFISLFIGSTISFYDSSLLSAGFYKDPALYVNKEKEILMKQLKQSKVLFKKEGISAHVAVRKEKDGVLSLRINGKADASTGEDMENQLLLGHLPMLLHKNPKEVLVVGMGSGITLGSVLSYPVEHVDAIEIEAAVVEAASFFGDYNNDALYDKRTKVIIADGRNYLLASSKKYDVISSEPSNPWLSGSSKLFTKEYFELLKNRITDDGVVIHWINLHSLDLEGVKSVLAAYNAVFAHIYVFAVPASNDLLLIGTKQHKAFDLSSIAERLKEEKVKRDLSKAYIREPFEVLAYFVFDKKELSQLVKGAPVNTDNNPYVEFSAPKNLYTSVTANPWRVILDHLTPIASIIYSSSDPPIRRGSRSSVIPDSDQESMDSRFRGNEKGISSRQARAIKGADAFRRSRLLTQVYSIEKNIGEGIKEGEKASVIDPDNLFIKETLAQFYFEEGTSFFNQSTYGKAIASFKKSLALKKTSEGYFNLGQSYGWDGDLESAQEQYKQAVALDLEFSEGWKWLGKTNQELGDLNGAIEAYKKVVDIVPKDTEALANLGQLYILRSDFGKAKKYLDKALKIDPEFEAARELLQKIP